MSKLLSLLRKNLGVLFLIMCSAAICGYALGTQSTESSIATFKKEMVDAPVDFQYQKTLYRDLLESVGAERAQEVFQSVMPKDVRSHALGHEVGYFLYTTEGLNGIYKCKNYFNGSCFHGFLERFIADHGIGEVSTIIDICKQGRTLYEARECAHGAGHGFVLIAGYTHLSDAAAQCTQSFKGEPERVISDCLDGVFMENNFGGFNRPPSDRWYKADDPMYPCDDSRIEAVPYAHDSCWFMQSQGLLNKYMYPQFEGTIEKAALYCADDTNGSDKVMCLDGLSRSIQGIAGTHLDEINHLCLAVYPADTERCLSIVAESAYAFGDHASALRLCDSVSTKKSCNESLFERITTTSYYTKQERLKACSEFSDASTRSQCATWVEKEALNAATQ